MVAIAALVVASAFLVITGFVFVFSVQKLLDADVWCPWYVQVVAIVWLALGLVADVAFNWLLGTLIFRELPHELVFTERVKRHYRRTDGDWRQRKAEQWAEFLNAVDAGHIK